MLDDAPERRALAGRLLQLDYLYADPESYRAGVTAALAAMERLTEAPADATRGTA